MARRRKGLPEREYSVEAESHALKDRLWVRKRWRKRRGEPVATCISCGTTLNRADTYYVRPAYTDGKDWLCSGCFDRLSEDADQTPDHRYGRRRNAE